MAIENRNLGAGAQLATTYKKERFTCEVVATDEGLRYKMPDGRLFKSPSAAGMAVTGRVSCDGWKFWSVAGESPDIASPVTPSGEGSRRKRTLLKVIRKLPNQKTVPEGSTKFFCSACMKSFTVEGTTVPETCPEGHARESEDELATAD